MGMLTDNFLFNKMAYSYLTTQILVALILIHCGRVETYSVNKEIVYVREIGDEVGEDGVDTEYPDEMSLTLHRYDYGDSFLQLLLEKYKVDFDTESEEKLTEDFDKSKLQGSCIYKVKDGQSLIKLKRNPQRTFHVQGTFCLGGKVGSIEPVNENPFHQKHYLSVDHLESQECDKYENKMVREDRESSKQINFKLSNAFGSLSGETLSNDRVKRAVEKLTIELLMVIDYAAYSWWETIVGKVGNTEEETMTLVRQYYAYVFQGIDSRFSSIDKQPFVIDLAFSGLFVAKTEQESYWTTTSTIDGDGDSTRAMVNSSEALEKFQRWLDEASSLPKYDHAILFTGTNLTYAGSPGNTGLAFASSMCRNISNSSIIEDIFDYRTITYATQQVARALGTRDDMDNNDCLEFFNYIMAPKLKLPIESFSSNKWKFSTCSEQYLKDYNTELNEDGLTCLKETSIEEKYPTKLLSLVKELPGVTYSGRKQCENAFGLHSDICRVEIGTNYAKICSGMLCTYPGIDKCGYILPADGTPCGNKKHCFQGSCIDKEDGLESSDTCVFGNDASMDCYRLVVSEPSQCYNNDIKFKCCKTCELFYTGISGCEYGDRSDDCTVSGCVHGDQDYVPNTCCLTCLDGPTPFARPIISATVEPTAAFSTMGTIPSSSPVPSASSSSFSTLIPFSLPTSPRTSSSRPSSKTTSTTPSISTFFIEPLEITSSTLSLPDLTFTEKADLSTPTGEAGLETDSTFNSQDRDEVTSAFPFTGNTPGETKFSNILTTLTPDISTPDLADTKNTDTHATPLSTIVTDQHSGTSYVITSSQTEQSSTLHKQYTDDTTEDKMQRTKYETPTSTSMTTKTSETQDSNRAKTDAPCPCSAVPTVSDSLTKPTAAVPDPIRCLPSHDKAVNQSFMNKLLFKDVARSMQDNQRRILGDVYHNVRSMYLAVSGHLRGYNREYENENESGREGSETISNDDDDINRKLKPIWIKYYQDLMRDLKRDVREMRYRVLALVNRHNKYQSSGTL